MLKIFHSFQVIRFIVHIRMRLCSLMCQFKTQYMLNLIALDDQVNLIWSLMFFGACLFRVYEIQKA
jgi:hypothetical protein